VTLSVGPLEALWIVTNLTTFALTLSALVDARADREAVKLLNGHARELAASGIVRREWIRLIVQMLLLAVAIPGVVSDREIVLTLPIAALMAVPCLLLLSSFLDARDRKALTVLVAADLLAGTTSELAAIRADIAENTRISQEASDHADKAYHEANDVNNKIARQGAALVQQGEDRASAAARLEGTVDATAGQVSDLHAGTAPETAT